MQLDNFTLFQDFLFKGEKPVSTLHVNGEIWFKGKQVAEILDYKNPRESIRDHVDKEDRMSLSNLKGSNSLHLEFNSEGQQIMINESGLYCLVFKSRKPEAIAFRKWITKEVIPSIRKTGKYENKELIEKIKTLENKTKELQIENKKLEQENDDISSANSKLNSTVDWYWEHDVTKTTDSFFQRLPPKKSGFIPANKSELLRREMAKELQEENIIENKNDNQLNDCDVKYLDEDIDMHDITPNNIQKRIDKELNRVTQSLWSKPNINTMKYKQYEKEIDNMFLPPEPIINNNGNKIFISKGEKCFRCHDIMLEAAFTCLGCKKLICEECAHDYKCKYLEDKKKPKEQRENIKCKCLCDYCVHCDIKRNPNSNTLPQPNIHPENYKQRIIKDMSKLLNNPYDFKYTNYK